MGNLVFLPSLLTESFIPETWGGVGGGGGGNGISISDNRSGISFGSSSSIRGGNDSGSSSGGSSGGDVGDLEDVIAAGRSKVTTCLSVFGAGGIVGNIAYGLAMTFGPMAGHHFPLFMGNNVMLLAFMGESSSYVTLHQE